MDGELQFWSRAYRKQEILRQYIIPTVGRILVAAMGVGLGYLIAHI